MNPTLVIGTAQFAPAPDAAANRAQIRAFAQEAADRGVRALIFPEESMLPAVDLGEPLGTAAAREWSPFLTTLSEAAREHGIWIVAGGYEPNETDRPYNTLVAFDAEGRHVTGYRKLHLYDAFAYRESDAITAGSELPPVILIDGIAIGLVNCYDLRFPELARDLVARGADVVSVSAAWVDGPHKEDHWRTLLRARAIENTAWVVAAGTTSPGCIGSSMIIDPLGVVRAALDYDTTSMAVSPVSLDRTAAVREILPSLANRRLRVVPSITE